MKTRNTILLGLCASAGALFVLPSLAFTTIGGSLSVSSNNYQRDFRVWNNSPDAASNDNTTPNASYPGALGAVMAVWKGAHEWGSDEAGNANFDFEFQGENTSNGGTDGNTVSWETSGTCSGGVLAYMNPGPGGISNGWTVRFCQGWNWSDGPGSVPGGQIDIEGVAVHELGHSLGLGHTNAGCSGACSNFATMCPFICGTGTEQRTLHSDDINGVQFIYGNKPANKPVITGLSGSFDIGGTLVISGQNFASTVNVKFTAGTSQNSGSIPGTVFNVPSSGGGTTVSVVIPAGAQDGSVTVWQPNTLMSNPFPIDIGSGGGGCAAPVEYGAGEVGSNGLLADISAIGGLPTVGNSSFAIQAVNLQPNQGGLLFTGTAQASTPVFWGTLLVGGTVTRTGIVTDGNGSVTVPVAITSGMVGTTLNYQVMARDGAAGNPQHTNAVSVTFCP